MQRVVTRFAPSPTGYIHLGNIRSAIYPYLIAQQTNLKRETAKNSDNHNPNIATHADNSNSNSNSDPATEAPIDNSAPNANPTSHNTSPATEAPAKFLLRIEDTDQSRLVPGATEMIEDVLRWLGLDWNEGYDAALKEAPAPGTPHLPAHDLGSTGPYLQSERKQIYHDWARKLIAQGRAYADPTPPEVIDQYRKEDNAKKVPYLYRNHRPTSTPEWHEGLPLRFRSNPQPYHWHDEVMGDLSTGPEVCDDIILIKKDGLPTYNFAHIVDDATMGVTHIARGVEYLPSMPNYLALYEALGLATPWSPSLPAGTPFRPLFLSLPHILAPQGNKKLSKRDGAKSATDYRAEGVLPEALLNYLACLGWNDGTEQEIYTKQELIEKFRIDHIQNSGARFDETKILWMNGQWIRKLVTEQGINAFYPRTLDFWPEIAKNEPDEKKKQVLAIIYDRLKTLSDLATMTTYFFADPAIDLPTLTTNKFLKKFSESELISLLTQSLAALTNLPDWTEPALQDALNQLLVTTEKKPAELFSLLRISVSFAPFSPALHQTFHVLGRETTLARLSAVRTALTHD